MSLFILAAVVIFVVVVVDIFTFVGEVDDYKDPTQSMHCIPSSLHTLECTRKTDGADAGCCCYFHNFCCCPCYCCVEKKS